MPVSYTHLNVLESGIESEVSPPGKVIKNLLAAGKGAQVLDDLARGRDLDLDAGCQHVAFVGEVQALSLIHILACSWARRRAASYWDWSNPLDPESVAAYEYAKEHLQEP